MPLRSTQSPSSTQRSREVNTLLHTLRGEQYRHERNVRGSQAQILRTLAPHAAHKQSLPISQLFGSLSITESEGSSRSLSEESVSRTPARTESLGPTRHLHVLTEGRETPEWREKALSLLFSQIPLRTHELEEGSDYESETVLVQGEYDGKDDERLPPLVELCLQVLLDYCRGRYFAEILVPYLPLHLRRVLLRWTAVHAPLPTSKLYALCEPDGHVGGELIVVGPQASLPPTHFASATEEAIGRRDIENNNIPELAESDGSWESSSSSEDTAPAIHTFALVTTSLSAFTLFSLPPTITHLALIGLPSPVPVHRLPRVCPLLEVLDLSYNLWLSYVQLVTSEESGTFVSVQGSSKGGRRVIDRVEWSRWSRLRVLGLRECGVGRSIVTEVNKGRWTDVHVVGADNGVLLL